MITGTARTTRRSRLNPTAWYVRYGCSFTRKPASIAIFFYFSKFVQRVCGGGAHRHVSGHDYALTSRAQVRVTDITSDNLVFEHAVKKGDVWRMCQTKDAPIKDWVRLAVSRARATGDATIFWLDEVGRRRQPF